MTTVKQFEKLNLPLNASSWSKEDLKDPEKLYEMTVLLNAQREIAEKILDAQWENKWRQEKVSLLELDYLRMCRFFLFFSFLNFVSKETNTKC